MLSSAVTSPPPRDIYPAYCFCVVFLVSTLALFEPALMHWFLIPVCVCAMLVGRDAIAWLTAQVDPFDPRGVLGMLSIHLFFVAPLLIVMWEFRYDVAPPPPDWRPWLGIMGCLNAIGLVIYQTVSKLVVAQGRPQRVRQWIIDENRVFVILIPAILLAGLAQMYLWFRYGGIVGQLATYKSGNAAAITGRFKYQVIGNAFPILLLIALTVLRSRRDRDRGRYSMAFVLLGATFILYFITDGLRGSRSSTIWTLFWAAGVIHYFWRRLSARFFMIALIPLVLFMYTYGLYKSYGANVLEVYEESGSVSAMAERAGRTSGRLFISELSRADIQSFMVYRLMSEGSNYELLLGRSYFETVPRLLIPKWIWPGRPEARKAMAGAYLHFNGPSPYGAGGLSKVYGLAGEAMLNFHIIGIPFAFALFGLLMGIYRRHYTWWQAYDARLFIAPFAANFFIAALVGDLDNLLTFAISKGVFPLLVLVLIVKRREI